MVPDRRRSARSCDRGGRQRRRLDSHPQDTRRARGDRRACVYLERPGAGALLGSRGRSLRAESGLQEAIHLPRRASSALAALAGRDVGRDAAVRERVDLETPPSREGTKVSASGGAVFSAAAVSSGCLRRPRGSTPRHRTRSRRRPSSAGGAGAAPGFLRAAACRSSSMVSSPR